MFDNIDTDFSCEVGLLQSMTNDRFYITGEITAPTNQNTAHLAILATPDDLVKVLEKTIDLGGRAGPTRVKATLGMFQMIQRGRRIVEMKI